MKGARIIYGLIFLAALNFVYFYGGIVPWTFFIIIICLPVVSYIYLVITYFSIRYYETTNSKNFIKGETIKYRCWFSNNIKFPLIYVKIYIQTPETVVSGTQDIIDTSIFSGKDRHLEYEIKCLYRGRYEIGIMRVEFRDFLNLFEMHLQKSNFISIVIYPRIKLSEEYVKEGMTLSDFRMSFFSRHKGEESISNLRDYSYGDSSRLIHWKLTARMNKLIVVDKESAFDSRVVLAIDLRKSNLPVSKKVIYEDRLIEEVVANANYFLQQNIPVDLVYYKNGLNVWHSSSMQDFDDIYNLLAEILFDAKEGIETVLYSIMADENKNNTFFVYCTELARDLYDNLTQLHVSGKNIFVRYCALDKGDDEVYNYKRILLKQGITIEQMKGTGDENEYDRK